MKRNGALALGGVLALACLVHVARSQMTSGSRIAETGKPLPAGVTAPEVNFEDLAEKAGLTGRNVSGSEKQQSWIVENTGTGLAVFDYDNDGLPDILLVNADRFEPGRGKVNHFLYHNLGNLKFEDVTAKSGITHDGWGQGACAGDFDNDGLVDVFITNWGQNQLFHNLGGGKFRNEAKERGVDGEPGRWSTGCSFFDYDRDGYLDLIVAHYLVFDQKNISKPTDPNPCNWKGFPVVCGPRGLPPETMSLYHNDGHGHFTDVTRQAGIGSAKAAGLTVMPADFDNDGWPDVMVAGDSTPTLLFHNKRDGTFEEIGLYAGTAYSEDGKEQSGMGLWAADYNRDGFLDVVKTNFIDDVPNLYRNLKDGSFVEVTSPAGLAIHTEFVSWGIAFLDFDHDGWKDIFIANGHVYPDIDSHPIGQVFKQPRVLYWNRRDGMFHDMSAKSGRGISDRHSSRGIAVADLDNDGQMEIVITNQHEHPSLLKNSAVKGNSLLVRALTPSGRDAIGARLTIVTDRKPQIDEVPGGRGYLSQSDFRVHFGLGTTTRVDLQIRWPDGTTDTVRDVAANQIVTVQEGKGLVRTAPFAKRGT